MFDALRNIGGMASLMKDMPKIKAKMEEVRRKNEAARVAASSGGGAVTVVASGRFRIESITVDPNVFAAIAAGGPADRALAIELVREATNAALERVQQAMAESLGEAARELNLPISADQLKELM